MKKIEAIESEFIKELNVAIRDHFPSLFGFEADYYLGEDNEGRRGLYFEIKSKRLGKIYVKIMILESYNTIKDVEDDFFIAITNDLVMAGVSFLHFEAHENAQFGKMDKLIRKRKFQNMMPPKLLFPN